MCDNKNRIQYKNGTRLFRYRKIAQKFYGCTERWHRRDDGFIFGRLQRIIQVRAVHLHLQTLLIVFDSNISLLLFFKRFFQLMGTVFGFVSSDVRSKIEILEAHRQKDNAEQFESFAKMMEYEKSSSLLDKKDYVSGSRTLLRLHRGLGNVNCKQCQPNIFSIYNWKDFARVQFYTLTKRDRFLH